MDITLTDRESDLMAVLWEHGACTVAQVREHLYDDLAYTTVLTILRTLEAKGYVGHETEGKAHRYLPLIERDAARRSALKHLSGKLFQGSAGLLMTHLVADGKLTDEEVRKIRQLLAKHSRKNKP